MLIAIGALVLVVVFLANKPMPGDQSSATQLPGPPSIPATGTSGVLSPAMQPGHSFGMPLLGTNAGQLIGQTNATVPQQPWKGNPPLPPRGTVSSNPQSTPLLGKELFTGVRPSTSVRSGFVMPDGFTKL